MVSVWTLSLLLEVQQGGFNYGRCVRYLQNGRGIVSDMMAFQEHMFRFVGQAFFGWFGNALRSAFLSGNWLYDMKSESLPRSLLSLLGQRQMCVLCGRGAFLVVNKCCYR